MWQVNEVMAHSELEARYTFSAFKAALLPCDEWQQERSARL